MSTDSKQAEPLLGQETEELRSRWQSIQSAFVDEPQEAVQRADALVTDVIERLTRTFQCRTRSRSPCNSTRPSLRCARRGRSS